MDLKSVSDISQPAASGEAMVGNSAQTSGWVRLARWAFVALAAAFALCVVVQIFIVGLAIFVHPLNWVRHTTFIHFFELLPVLMLIFSWIGRLPGRQRWHSAGLFGLIYVQYFTANFRAIAPWVAALHPVVAMGIAWLAFQVFAEAWKLVANRRTV